MGHTKPFLKWAGNKYSCLNDILGSFPKATRLIEPFTGSGAIFANTNYERYLLAEANPDLVSLYRHLQNDGDNFIAICKQYFTFDNNNALNYYALREKFNKSTINQDRAALFLYLNRHGYNGLCRYNQQGIYNVPYGYYVKPYFPQHELMHFKEKIHKAEFIENDFKQTFKLAQPGDVIYCDPPYVPLSKTANFSSYTKNKFTNADQIMLAELARESAVQGIKVIISNHDTEFTRKYYKGAKISSFPVRRKISCKANLRIPVQELIAVFK